MLAQPWLFGHATFQFCTYVHQKGEVVCIFVMKSYRAVRAVPHSYLTWAVDGVKWLSYAPTAVPPEKEPPNQIEYEAS